MSSDLIERDEAICLYKQKEVEYEALLKEKDAIISQDSMIRFQLGKRLEQVLIDKVEALERLEEVEVIEHSKPPFYSYM